MSESSQSGSHSVNTSHISTCTRKNGQNSIPEALCERAEHKETILFVSSPVTCPFCFAHKLLDPGPMMAPIRKKIAMSSKRKRQSKKKAKIEDSNYDLTYGEKCDMHYKMPANPGGKFSFTSSHSRCPAKTSGS